MNIKDWWTWPFYFPGKIREGFRNFERGINNLWKYRKIVWNDIDWDSEDLLKLMRFKIDNMSKNFSKAQYYDGWDIATEQMDVAVEILDRLINHEFYYMTPEMKEYVEKQHEEFLADDIDIKKYLNERTDEERLIYSKLSKENCEFYFSERDKDLDKLFKILKDHLFDWSW